MNNSQTILSSQSDNQESVNISLLNKLKNLIKPDRETGKKAWEAGKDLSQLQDQEDSESFEDLIAQELGLSKAQAERFIEIKKWIENPALITKNMAISHLEQVIRLKDHKVIETLLKDLAEIEKNTETDKIPYNEKIIGIVVSKYKQRCKKQPNNKKYAGLQLDLFGANNQESTKIDFEFKDYLIAEISDYESQTKQDKDRDKWGRDVAGITKKERPLAPQHFAEFEQCYGDDPDGNSPRKDLGIEGRFRCFNISEVKQRDYKLDITWLKDESLEDELPEPQFLASEAITELEAVVDDLKDILQLIELNGESE